MKPGIAQHDLDRLIKRAEGFLEKGHRTRVIVQFIPRRTAAHPEIAEEILNQFLSIDCKKVKGPHNTGSRLELILDPP